MGKMGNMHKMRDAGGIVWGGVGEEGPMVGGTMDGGKGLR